jgi:hypothetical protein
MALASLNLTKDVLQFVPRQVKMDCCDHESKMYVQYSRSCKRVALSRVFRKGQEKLDVKIRSLVVRCRECLHNHGDGDACVAVVI